MGNWFRQRQKKRTKHSQQNRDCGVNLKGEIEMATVSSDYAVQMHGITKRFWGVYALKRYESDVKRAASIPLLGENGAGKVH